jgi:hypothetical protein
LAKETCETELRLTKGIAGPVDCQKVVTAVDDPEAKPSREDRANRFIWGPDDVEHH